MWPRAAKVSGHLDDALVVDAALDDHVDLDRPEPGFIGGVDRFEHVADRKIDVVHRAEHRVIERVEADGDPIEAGILECARFLAGQKRAVRRQREVLKSADLRQHLDEALEVAAQERLAAGQTDLLDAQVDESARQPGDLFERHQLLATEELEVAAEDLARHAVRAAEVAAVGDRDAKVAQRTAEGVEGHVR